jgi:hypothetical protein
VLVEAISREYRSLKRTPEVYSFVSKLMIRDIGLEIKHFGYKIGSSFLIYWLVIYVISTLLHFL